MHRTANCRRHTRDGDGRRRDRAHEQDCDGCKRIDNSPRKRRLRHLGLPRLPDGPRIQLLHLNQAESEIDACGRAGNRSRRCHHHGTARRPADALRQQRVSRVHEHHVCRRVPWRDSPRWQRTLCPPSRELRILQSHQQLECRRRPLLPKERHKARQRIQRLPIRRLPRDERRKRCAHIPRRQRLRLHLHELHMHGVGRRSDERQLHPLRLLRLAQTTTKTSGSAQTANSSAVRRAEGETPPRPEARTAQRSKRRRPSRTASSATTSRSGTRSSARLARSSAASSRETPRRT